MGKVSRSENTVGAFVGKLVKSPFATALFSFAVYWSSLEPLGLCWLVFLVPVLWYPLYGLSARANLSERPLESAGASPSAGGSPSAGQKRKSFFFRFWGGAGRCLTSFYGQLWGATALFWLVITVWLTFPHPATLLGWVALSFYLAIYFPLFIAIVRFFVSKSSLFLVPAVLSGWLFTEVLRKWGLGGFSFASLEHAFYRTPVMIQIADLVEEYGVGLMIVLTGTLVALAIWPFLEGRKSPLSGKKKAVRFLLCCLMIGITIGSTTWYGYFRLAEYARLEAKMIEEKVPRLRIALLQENTTFHYPVPEETNLAIHKTYLQLSRDAVNVDGPLDLIVWPESTFSDVYYNVTPNGGYFPGLESLSPEEREEKIEAILQKQRSTFLQWEKSFGTPFLLGIPTLLYNEKGEAACYNSALLIDDKGEFPRYDKNNLVMFGEYLPFADYLPDWFPLKTLGLSVAAGEGPVLFTLEKEGHSTTLLVNICFESSIARLIHSHIRQLRGTGRDPDILVNISNDGWFWYSSQIEYHLATNVFRAVETRKQVLTATHAGYAAWIDSSGIIRSIGKRGASQYVLATPFVNVR